MREHLRTALGKQISLEDGSHYHYVVTQVEVNNALGAIVAVLDEFLITDEAGNVYKLHKTKEGNWYDFEAEKSGGQPSVLQRLKRAIDNQFKQITE
ncbi:hypothetical protein IQ13_0930 [Lacibacter cauensis]|uniref:Uncharacterized protein n=1 Tax=Lacibacter cauensis TaxID=510947 RepID=A0A562SWZ0_9BACT|nr:hypothetical protein [Lacibacter cauensis]TWI85762.1 hypothetical protein IQ13_0930 [Lacibacter cauensis]